MHPAPLLPLPLPSPQLPFFVYGTLRQGESNAARLHPAAIRVQSARILAAQLFDLGPYPMLLEFAPGEEEMLSGVIYGVVGELVEVEPTHYERTLHSLDELEGVDGSHPDAPHSLYQRVARDIRLENGDFVSAWVYLGREDVARRGRLVPTGDWKRRFNFGKVAGL